MASKDFCISGTPAIRDDCQTALKEVQRLTSLAIDAAIKAQNAADPVAELLCRQLIDSLQQAHGQAVRLQSARNAHHAS